MFFGLFELSIAFIFCLALIASSLMAAFTAFDGATGVRLLIAGFGLACAALSLTPLERSHYQKVVRLPVLIAVLPVAFILFQLAPVPGLTNSIWASTSEALGQAVTGHLTVDVGDTVLAFTNAFLWITTLLLTAAVTVDRDRAQETLFVLALVAVLLASIAPAALIIVGAAEPAIKALSIDSGAVGLVLTLACADLAYERFETRRGKQAHAVANLVIVAGVCLVGFGLCIGIVSVLGDRAVIFAAACGVAVFIGIVLMRRLGLGNMTNLALAVTIVGGAFIVAAAAYPAGSHLVLAYAVSSDTSIEAARRMIEDAPLIGTGAGTFSAMSHIYRILGTPPLDDAPTAAARLLIEFGLPMVCIILVAVGLLSIPIIRGAFGRGRDSAYCIAAASGLVAFVLLAFVNASILQPSIGLVAAALLGLALAQSQSRSVS